MFLLTFRKSRKEEKETAENLDKSNIEQITTSPPERVKESPKNIANNEGSRSLSNILKHKPHSSSFKESSLISIKDSFSSKTRSYTLPFNRSINTPTNNNILDQSIDSSYASNNSIRISSCGEHSSSSSGSTDNNNNNLIMTTAASKSSNNNNTSTNGNSTDQISPIVQQPLSVKSNNKNFPTSVSLTSVTSSSSPTSNSSPLNESLNSQNNKSCSNNNIKENSVSYLDDSNLKLAIIEYSDILKLVKLQNSIEYQEWMAFNTKMFFEQINVLYGAIAEYCTPKTCPTMNAPLNNHFYWLDDKGKKCKYSASQYIDTVLTYAAKATSDERLFPTKLGIPFPPQFDTLVKKINKHLFQILAHMYHSHYTELLQLKLNTYVNSIYLHFYSFNRSFSILDDKEIEIMDTLNKSMLNKYMDNNTNSLQHQLVQQQPPLIHQAASNSGGGSTGFSFFKKKLNFNLMA